MSLTAFNGFLATATVNGVDPSIMSWSVDPTVGITELWSSLGGGFINVQTNFQRCTFSLVLELNFAQNPFQAPLTLQIGTAITNTKLFTHQSGFNTDDGLAWQFPAAVIISTPQRAELAGKITTSINCRANGPFTYLS